MTTRTQPYLCNKKKKKRKMRRLYAGTRMFRVKSYTSISGKDAVCRSAERKAFKYCQDLVKKHDHDHYLCNLLLPRVIQAAAFTLRAFNVEVALIGDAVSERDIGAMRVQFWRDLLDSVYKGDPPQQPVALALANVLRHQRLSKHWFSRLLDAREAELSTTVYLSTQAMETYAENTSSSLLYLTLEAAGVKDINADHAASHLGKAEGIVMLLRSMAYYRSKRLVLLPADLLMRHGVTQEDILRKKDATQQTKDAIFDFASLANSHLSKARSLEKHLPLTAKRVLLPAVVCDNFLKRIQLADFNPFASSFIPSDPKLAAQLLWKSLRRTY